MIIRKEDTYNFLGKIEEILRSAKLNLILHVSVRLSNTTCLIQLKSDRKIAYIQYSANTNLAYLTTKIRKEYSDLQKLMDVAIHHLYV